MHTGGLSATSEGCGSGLGSPASRPSSPGPGSSRWPGWPQRGSHGTCGWCISSSRWGSCTGWSHCTPSAVRTAAWAKVRQQSGWVAAATQAVPHRGHRRACVGARAGSAAMVPAR
eukprot:505782-Prymnesium_polylepis.1